MKDQTGLVRREASGIYYYRARVPLELQPLLGKTVIFESLKTRERDEAIVLAAAKRHEIAQELARIRRARTLPAAPLKRLFLSDDEIRAICERYVATALAADDELRMDGMSEDSSGLYADILEQHHAVITTACARGDTSAVHDLLAQHLRQQVGLQLDEGSKSHRRLAFEFLKAEAQVTKFRLARQRGEHVRTPDLSIAHTTFAALIQAWAAHTSATKTTRAAFQAAFDELLLVHPGLSVESTTKEHLKRWKDVLQQDGQAPGTIDKKLSYLRAAFNVAVDNDLIVANPAKGIKAPKTKGQKSRVPFSVEELQRFFACDIYLKGERPKGGAGEAAYWIPLIAHWSGARLEEIAQLRVIDVLEHKGLGWYFNLTDEGDGRLKTVSARRRVPVHSELLRLGLLAYVDAMRKQKKVYVFPDLVADVKGARSGNFSKWFGRYKRSIGLTDKRTVFHSFRHGFVDACRDSGVLPEIRDVLVGHANPSTAASYGEGNYPIAPLFEAMAKVRYPGVDLSGLPVLQPV